MSFYSILLTLGIVVAARLAYVLGRQRGREEQHLQVEEEARSLLRQIAEHLTAAQNWKHEAQQVLAEQRCELRRVLSQATANSNGAAEANGTPAKSSLPSVAELERVVAPLAEWAERAESAQAALGESVEQLTELAKVDVHPITSIPTRHRFEQELSQIFRHAERYETAFAVSIFEIDLAGLTDLPGNDWKVELARLVRENVRETDFLAHFDTTTYAVIMPRTESPVAAQATERLRRKLEESSVLSLCAGASAYLDGDVPRTLLDRAREALHSARVDGRNCSYLHNGLVAERVKLQQPEPAPVEVG